MNLNSITEYLEYSPPALQIAALRTSDRTTLPANGRIDSVLVNTWNDFIPNAIAFKDQMIQRHADALLPSLPEREVYSVASESQVVNFMAMNSIVLQRLTSLIHGTRIAITGQIPSVALNADNLVARIDGTEFVPLCPIEYKTPYALPIPAGGDLLVAYETERKLSGVDTSSEAEFTRISSNTADTKYSRAIAQLWGYMSVNCFKYGVLSTFNETYFFQRVEHCKDSLSELKISPAIICPVDPTGNTNLSVMAAWSYFTHLLMEGYLYTSPYTTPNVKYSLVTRDPFEPQNIQMHQLKFKNIGDPLAIKSTVKLDDNLNAYIKFFDPSKDNEDNEAAEKFYSEIEAYKSMSGLMGKKIPVLYGSFIVSGLFYALLLELCGEEIQSQEELVKYSNQIKQAYEAIHKCGVIHGDVDERHLFALNGSIRVIDFDRCKLKSKYDDSEWEALVEDENIRVDSLVD